jgi:hypothetical protein
MRAARQQRIGETPARGEMQISEQHLPRAQQRILRRQRLLHLHDQPRRAPHRLGSPDQLRPRVRKPRIRDAGAEPRPRLHQHPMPRRDQVMHQRRHRGDAPLLRLDLSGEADDHRGLLRADWRVNENADDTPPSAAQLNGYAEALRALAEAD